LRLLDAPPFDRDLVCISDASLFLDGFLPSNCFRSLSSGLDLWKSEQLEGRWPSWETGAPRPSLDTSAAARNTGVRRDLTAQKPVKILLTLASQVLLQSSRQRLLGFVGEAMMRSSAGIWPELRMLD
jgi:hypothetical protein